MLCPLIAYRGSRFRRKNCNGNWHGSHLSDIRNPTSTRDCSVNCPRVARSDHLVETTWANPRDVFQVAPAAFARPLLIKLRDWPAMSKILAASFMSRSVRSDSGVKEHGERTNVAGCSSQNSFLSVESRRFAYLSMAMESDDLQKAPTDD